MSPIEAREFREFSQDKQKEVSILQREFGLVKVDPQRERGVPHFAYISEFDGWAVERESFLGRWLEFPPVARLKGIAQLGLNRYLPLPNFQTRFEHSAEVAVRTILTLSSLARDSRRDFLALSQDYSLNLNPDLSEQERKDKQISKTIKLGAIYAALHDIASPAGGDTIKYIFGLDDDRDFPEVLSWNSTEFSRLCQEDGFDPEQLVPIFTKIAQRNDEGILGQLIHRSGGENRGFDLDSISYTLMDAQRCLEFSREGRSLSNSGFLGLSREEIIEDLLEVAAFKLMGRQGELNRWGRDFVSRNQSYLRRCYSNGLPYDLDPVIPSWAIRSISTSLVLDDFTPFSCLALKEGRVVFTDPYKVNTLWLLQDLLVNHLYFSPSVLGPEIGLGVAVNTERSKPLSTGEKRYLLTANDRQFQEHLRRNSPSLAYWFSNLASLGWEGENLSYVSQTQISAQDVTARPELSAFFESLVQIKQMPSRLDIPVLIWEKTRSFGELFPQRTEEVERKKRLYSYLTDIMPFYARPLSWLWTDECSRLERHRLEKQPYW